MTYDKILELYKSLCEDERCVSNRLRKLQQQLDLLFGYDDPTFYELGNFEKHKQNMHYWLMEVKRDNYVPQIHYYTSLCEWELDIMERWYSNDKEQRQQEEYYYYKYKELLDVIIKNEERIDLANKIYDLEQILICDMSIVNTFIELFKIDTFPLLKYTPWLDYAYFEIQSKNDLLMCQDSKLSKKLSELEDIIMHIDFYIYELEKHIICL